MLKLFKTLTPNTVFIQLHKCYGEYGKQKVEYRPLLFLEMYQIFKQFMAR